MKDRNKNKEQSVSMIWSKAQQVAQAALTDGSLLPLSTAPRELLQDGVRYLLHIKNHNSKVKFSPKPKDFNPFLPYEESMYVAPAGDEHVCLLNKFPVLNPHLLICSNDFIEQTSPLTEADFHAWLIGFNESEVLGFYNGGPIAGASQPHRHMQLIKAQVPLADTIVQGNLPFEHRLFRYTATDAQTLYKDYLDAMYSMALHGNQQCKPHNILLTENWMLILPRSNNNIEGIFANGINYSGHFLLANEAQIKWLEAYGVMRFLSGCSA